MIRRLTPIYTRHLGWPVFPVLTVCQYVSRLPDRNCKVAFIGARSSLKLIEFQFAHGVLTPGSGQ